MDINGSLSITECVETIWFLWFQLKIMDNSDMSPPSGIRYSTLWRHISVEVAYPFTANHYIRFRLLKNIKRYYIPLFKIRDEMCVQPTKHNYVTACYLRITTCLTMSPPSVSMVEKYCCYFIQRVTVCGRYLRLIVGLWNVIYMCIFPNS